MKPVESITNSEKGVNTLIARCASRDPKAYDELFARYNRKIFNTAYRILGEEASAEDALQETLLNIYRGIKSFRGESKMSTWISRITINVCLGMLRKKKGRRFIDIDDETTRQLPAEKTHATDPLSHASRNELRTLIGETFRRMSKKQGKIVHLHDMEGNTIQEIAGIVGCPAGTVKSRLFYGRQEFKSIFNLLRNKGFAAAAALS